MDSRYSRQIDLLGLSSYHVQVLCSNSTHRRRLDHSHEHHVDSDAVFGGAPAGHSFFRLKISLAMATTLFGRFPRGQASARGLVGSTWQAFHQCP